jgi:hypothetical protein
LEEELKCSRTPCCCLTLGPGASSALPGGGRAPGSPPQTPGAGCRLRASTAQGV